MNNSRDIICGLGGRWYQNYGTAACPVCQPEGRKTQNALTLRDAPDGRLLAHCKKGNCPFPDILAALGVKRGEYHAPDPAEVAKHEAERRVVEEKRAMQATRVWKEALPIAGTLAEIYLRSRGIIFALPESLRFHPDCWHPTAKRFPAMVARISGGDSFAVHRTYLRADGSGKTDVSPAKAMLGAASGGSVRLNNAQGLLLVGEGIESTLAAAQILDVAGSVWAALSTSGLAGLTLPSGSGTLMIAVDGDDAGRKAGKTLATRAVKTGWTVKIADPGDGMDFADLVEVSA